MRFHKAEATISTTEAFNGPDGFEQEGTLVVFCCRKHAEWSGSVGGARVEYPRDGTPYALTTCDLTGARSELELDGFAVTEGA